MLFEGIATTPRLDAYDTRIQAVRIAGVPLMWRHTAERVGVVRTAWRAPDQSLRVVIESDDPRVQVGVGLSIGFIPSGVTCDAGTCDIGVASVVELSATPHPANSDCVITRAVSV